MLPPSCSCSGSGTCIVCQGVQWALEQGLVALSPEQPPRVRPAKKPDGRTKEGKQAAATRLAKERARWQLVSARRKEERAAARALRATAQAATVHDTRTTCEDARAVVEAINARVDQYREWKARYLSQSSRPPPAPCAHEENGHDGEEGANE